MWVYIWTSELKNTYIGEEAERPYTPTTNTLAYYPFKWSWVWEVWGTAVVWSWSSISSNYATVNNSTITCPLTESFNPSGTAFTFSIWLNTYRLPSYNPRVLNDNQWQFVIIIWNPDYKVILQRNSESSSSATYVGYITGNAWYNVVITYSGNWNTVYLYLNWTKYTYTNWLDIRRSGSNMVLGYNNSNDGAYFYLWEFILEKWMRSDAQVTNYYNSSKSRFGL